LHRRLAGLVSRAMSAMCSVPQSHVGHGQSAPCRGVDVAAHHHRHHHLTHSHSG
jgi:hypothetical protein